MKSTILKIKSTLLLALISGVATAQNAEVADAPNPNSIWNKEELLQPLALAMLGVIVLLFFAILAMAKVMKQSAFITRTRMLARNNAKKITMILAIVSVAYSNSAIAQADAASAAPPAKLIGGLSQFSFYLLLSVIVVMILAIIAMARAFKYTLGADAIEVIKPTTAKEKKLSWWERMNKTKSVEGVDEASVSTGHDYDGIGELDNPTPPWWNFGFIAGIVFSVVYLWVYHVTHSAPNQYEIYEADQKEAQIEIAKYLAKAGNNVDENTVTVTTNQADIDAGKAIFAEKCVACHLADGGGSIGPNLTDGNWIHGCSINDIFRTVKYGVTEKGMTPWKDQLTPKQIAQVANYVKTLKGTKPAVAKAPDGVPCDASAAAAATDADSTATKVTDTSSATPKDTTAATK